MHSACTTLAVERTVVNRVPMAIERPWRTSNCRSSFLHRKDTVRKMSLSRILGDETKKLNDLANKLIATQILDSDYEAYRPKI
jgi:hypothetical protein